jgi:hypothetical protein
MKQRDSAILKPPIPFPLLFLLSHGADAKFSEAANRLFPALAA